MKTLIVYATTHGCTEECAMKIKDGLEDETTLVNIKKASVPNLHDFDTILIGGSIHAGMIQRKLKKFCKKNEALLLDKKLGLFLCCMEEGEKAQEQFENAFPQKLRDHAVAKGFFGGAFRFDRMNAIEKAIIKKVAQIESDVSKISEKNISNFIGAIKK